MTWQRVNLSDPAYARPTEPPITFRLLYRACRLALIGPPESAKTLLALILGLEHMRAGHGVFAVVDFEMGEHATRLLLTELGATTDEIASVYYVAADGPPDGGDLEALLAASVSLVIIDAAAGAYDASALNDNERADAERFGRVWVNPLWQLGIAVVLIDHVVKNAENRGRFAIGSERKLGTVDVALGLEAIEQLHRGASGLIRITTHKDRPGHLPRPTAGMLRLDSDPDTNRITWTLDHDHDHDADDGQDHDSWHPTILMEKVSAFLQEHAAPVSRGSVERANLGKNVKWVRRALDDLIAGGYVEEKTGPRKARLNRLVRPFTATSSSSSDPVPDVDELTSSTSSAPYKGDEVQDEVERLAALIHADELTAEPASLVAGSRASRTEASA